MGDGELMAKRFGLLHHPRIPEAPRLAQEAATTLQALGAEVWSASAYDEAQILRHGRDSDLIISFGGDGTIVRVARTIAGLNVPLLGVNLGRIGFLAELQPEEVPAHLQALVDGRFWLEERMMLHADLRRGERTIQSFEAINDVVASRGRIARVVRIQAYVDGECFTTYVADGVIVSTPTGSTAYALAAGGPILDPQLRNLLLKPIAPHLTVATALVLPAAACVRLALSTDSEAALTVDGQVNVPLQEGDVVEVTASRNVCRFVPLGERSYFYRTLLQKLE